MDLRQVFLYYLKEHNIVGIAKVLFQEVNGRRFGRWEYNYPGPSEWVPLSFGEYLEEKAFRIGFNDLFWSVQPLTHDLLLSEKYRKARNGWNKFIRNNLNFSRNFVKEGDEIELINSWGDTIKGTVAFIPPSFSYRLPIMMKRHRRKGYSIQFFELGDYQRTIINGEEKKPSFSIKKNRKVYA